MTFNSRQTKHLVQQARDFQVPAPAPAFPSSASTGGMLYVRNDTGSDIDEPFHVLELADWVFDSDDPFPEGDLFLPRWLSAPIINGVLPGDGGSGVAAGMLGVESGAYQYAVLQSPCLNGQSVPAVLSGETLAYVQLLEEADITRHNRAFVAAGDSVFSSTTFGPHAILYRPTGTASSSTGAHLCYVKLNDPVAGGFALAPLEGIPARSGTTPGSARCTPVYLQDGVFVQSTSYVMVYNFTEAVVPTDLTSERLFPYIVIGHRAWIIAEDCADDTADTTFEAAQ